MGILDKFKTPAAKQDEITLQGIRTYSEQLDEASNHFLQCFGPAFTETTDGHIATDIAGASAIAGLMILRSTGIGLDRLAKIEPGNVILGEEINQKQKPVLSYITAIASNMGVSPDSEFDIDNLGQNKPLFDTLILTSKLEHPFCQACEKAKLPQLYYPIAAALTAMKLVGAGKDMDILDPIMGKNIAIYYTVAGSKTVPQPIIDS